jgi:hypothetical protein
MTDMFRYLVNSSERNNPQITRIKTDLNNLGLYLRKSADNFLRGSLVGVSLVLSLFLSGCYSDSDKWTDKDHKETLHYFAALRDNKEASRISRQAGNTFSPQQKEQIRALTAAALDAARQVSDELLDKVYPGMKEHWRDEFQTALELALVNLDNHDMAAAQKSTALFSQYSDWFNAHQGEIHFPQ